MTTFMTIYATCFTDLFHLRLLKYRVHVNASSAYKVEEGRLLGYISWSLKTSQSYHIHVHTHKI